MALAILFLKVFYLRYKHITKLVNSLPDQDTFNTTFHDIFAECLANANYTI